MIYLLKMESLQSIFMKNKCFSNFSSLCNITIQTANQCLQMYIAPKSKSGLYVIFSVRLCAQYKNIKMTHDTHLFSVCLCVFKCNDSSLSKLKFISQKNFDFICQNRAFLRRAQTHEKTHEKKNPDHIFFLCAYAFSSAKIHLSQNLNSSLRKTLILFVKTVRTAPRTNA